MTAETLVYDDVARTSCGWFDIPILDGFYVYALYGADNPDVPLYVGQSVNVLGRVSHHVSDVGKRRQVTRIAIRQCTSKDDMDETELRFIVAYCPPWNTAGMPYGVRRRRALPNRGSEAAIARAKDKNWQEFLASAWLTPRDVADRLNCSVGHVNRHVDKGDLTSTAGAHRWSDRRFRPEWVADLLQAQPDLLVSAFPLGSPARLLSRQELAHPCT